MGRVLIAEDVEGVVGLAQLDRAVRRQIAARRAAVREVPAREQRLRAVVVARVEVGLSQPECILVIVCIM
jgi:hypothetical protein